MANTGLFLSVKYESNLQESGCGVKREARLHPIVPSFHFPMGRRGCIPPRIQGNRELRTRRTISTAKERKEHDRNTRFSLRSLRSFAAKLFCLFLDCARRFAFAHRARYEGTVCPARAPRKDQTFRSRFNPCIYQDTPDSIFWIADQSGSSMSNPG